MLLVFPYCQGSFQKPSLSLVSNSVTALVLEQLVLPGGTCYIVTFWWILQNLTIWLYSFSSERCLFLSFLIPKNCKLDLCFYALCSLFLSSSSLQWTAVQPSCAEVECTEGKWENHRNAAAGNSIPTRPNQGEGAKPCRSASVGWNVS